jgi:hypothetical protein
MNNAVVTGDRCLAVGWLDKDAAICQIRVLFTSMTSSVRMRW